MMDEHEKIQRISNTWVNVAAVVITVWLIGACFAVAWAIVP